MTKSREAEANDFDLALFRLFDRAIQNKQAAHGPDRRRWGCVVEKLAGARPAVRGMMSDEDRERTA